MKAALWQVAPATVAAALAFAALVCLFAGALYARLRLRRWSAALWSELSALQNQVKAVENQLPTLHTQLQTLHAESVYLRGRVQARQQQLERRFEIVPDRTHENEIVAFLRNLDHPNDASRRYLEVHFDRTVRTMTLVPKAKENGAALELGSYQQMAAVLHGVLGYRTVRGAYYGRAGHSEQKTISAGGKTVFQYNVDLFDAEKDPFPYPDQTFSVVLACEIIEHLLHDPMHMLVESRRVLQEDGLLILSTPNVCSLSSLTRVLESSGNPQVYSLYPRLESERPHVREFTPQELLSAVTSAGFAVQFLFTEGIAGVSHSEWVENLLTEFGLPTALRGEQVYIVAKKTSGVAIDRYPALLYEQRSDSPPRLSESSG